MYPLNRLFALLILWILWLPSSGQDSLKFSLDEARTIALRLVELRECRELLNVTENQYSYCDSLVQTMDLHIQGLESKLTYKDKIIDLQIKDNRVLKRKAAGTVAIASVIVLVSLFIAIK